MKFRYQVLAVSFAVALASCSAEPGSQQWCEEKKEEPKSQWTLDDASTFASHCLIDDLTIGSEQWCERLKEKPKGEWTADEGASYARHCVM